LFGGGRNQLWIFGAPVLDETIFLQIHSCDRRGLRAGNICRVLRQTLFPVSRRVVARGRLVVRVFRRPLVFRHACSRQASRLEQGV